MSSLRKVVITRSWAGAFRAVAIAVLGQQNAVAVIDNDRLRRIAYWLHAAGQPPLVKKSNMLHFGGEPIPRFLERPSLIGQ